MQRPRSSLLQEAESSRRRSSLANVRRSNVTGRSSDSQTTIRRAFSPGMQFQFRQWQKKWRIDRVWSQRRGRPGFSPEFPVHRLPDGQAVTNNAIRFKGPNLSDRRPGVKPRPKVGRLPGYRGFDTVSRQDCYLWRNTFPFNRAVLILLASQVSQQQFTCRTSRAVRSY